MQVGVAYCATEVNFFLRTALHFVRQCSTTRIALHFVRQCSTPAEPFGLSSEFQLRFAQPSAAHCVC